MQQKRNAARSNLTARALVAARGVCRGMKHALGFCLTAAFAIALHATGADSASAEEGRWVTLWQDAYKGMTDPRFDPERMSTVVAVDRTSGDAYLSMWDYGIWKSSDEGKSFARVDGGKISGGGCGPIQGNSFYIHPEGQRLVTF